MSKQINLCITGAAGNIAYSLYNKLLSSDIFGENYEIDLRLVEVQQRMNQLEVLKSELLDCCFQKVKSINNYSQNQQAAALSQADLVIFLGAALRKPGMDLHEVFEQNAMIFKQYGKSLDQFARKTCKSLVVANPTNTNCLILSCNAPSIPTENFTCLTRLDYNRLVAEVSRMFECKTSQVKNAIVWGNHSKNQFCDLNFVEVDGINPKEVREKLQPIASKTMEKKIHEHGSFIADKTNGGTFMSAAKSIMDHLRDWYLGSDKMVTMGVIVKKKVYSLPENVCFSLPTKCYGGCQYQIVDDLELNPEEEKRIQDSLDELLKEKGIINNYLYEEVEQMQ